MSGLFCSRNVHKCPLTPPSQVCHIGVERASYYFGRALARNSICLRLEAIIALTGNPQAVARAVPPRAAARLVVFWGLWFRAASAGAPPRAGVSAPVGGVAPGAFGLVGVRASAAPLAPLAPVRSICGVAPGPAVSPPPAWLCGGWLAGGGAIVRRFSACRGRLSWRPAVLRKISQ